ncbi:MAG TPA: GntR family transcriptional regulator [Tepidisphaeraceae bacterium]|nr:GntR family transcriptional regulator [Tepidisphaeraceae bacterium]
MQMESFGVGTPQPRRRTDGLSYKFQRLRERLRQAVSDGELAGKLPGERALARRYQVNAKTLSKALTDLAAEGLLDRSIGRGTYVKGSAPADHLKTAKWLIVCDYVRADTALVRHLREACPTATVVHEVFTARPSFTRQFEAVIDFCTTTPDTFLKDLVVRNIPVVSVNRESGLYSVNTVGTDRSLGAWNLARDLVQGGHRRLAVIESMPRAQVGRTVGLAAQRYAPDATVQVWAKADTMRAVESGATAIVCDTTMVGKEVHATLTAAGVRIGQDVSVGAIGCADETYPLSGYLCDSRDVATAVIDVVASGNTARPAQVWLAPQWVDRGTTRNRAV